MTFRENLTGVQSKPGWSAPKESYSARNRVPASRKRAEGQAPSGYDQHYWHLALLFEQDANGRAHLTVGPPIIHDHLKRVFGAARLGARSEWLWAPAHHAVSGHLRKAVHYQDLWKDGSGRKLTEQQVEEAIVKRFFTDKVVEKEGYLARGLDGFNLDSVTYLHERVITSWQRERRAARRANG